MKKFFVVVPLQKKENLRCNVYRAVGNTKLQMEEATHFPILTVVNGYAEPGEDFRMIAVMTDTEDCRCNRDTLRAELERLCAEKGLVCSRGVETVTVPVDDRVATHMATFQKLIGMVEDDDELFSCMTFGTKPLSTAVQMAVQYAYRVQRNASIRCMVYGGIDRSVEPPESCVYDMTALVQMDEIVRLLADQGVKDPKSAIDSILSL